MVSLGVFEAALTMEIKTSDMMQLAKTLRNMSHPKKIFEYNELYITG
jgi:hypothetical protein